MTPWTWWAGELDDGTYGLAEGKTRDEVILEASRQMKPGEQFRIVEARASEDKRHEGSDCVPFLRTRNKEIITVGPTLANPAPIPIVRGPHLRAVGIGRDPENDQVVFLSLNRRPTDDEVRAIHGAIGRTPATCPFCTKPTYVLPCSHCGEPDVPDNDF